MWFIRGKVEINDEVIPCYTDLAEEYIFPTLFMKFFSPAPKISLLDLCSFNIMKALDDIGGEITEEFTDDDNVEEETEEDLTDT